MKRYIKVTRSAAGKTMAKVTIVDGELVSVYESGTYTGGIGEAIKLADGYARQQMEAMRRACDDLEHSAEVAA